MSHDTNRRRAVLLSVAIVGLIALAMATVAFAATPGSRSAAGPAATDVAFVGNVVYDFVGSVTSTPTVSPSVSSISPTSAEAGGSSFTLTVSGADFAVGAAILWNGVALSGSRESSETAHATVPAALIASAGTASVAVGNPIPGGYDMSNSKTFTIIATAPLISSVVPISAAAGGPAFTLQVNGSNFATGLMSAQVRWNGVALALTSGVIVNPTAVLYATVPASAILTPGTATITVVNPTLGGGVVSNPVTFPILGPTLTAITPNTGANTDAALAFVLTGTNLGLATSPSVALKGTGTNVGTIVNATGVVLVPSPLLGGAPTIGGSLNLTATAASATTLAPPGVYDVVLTYTSAGVKTLTLAGAFTVSGPSLTAISPVTATNGNAAVAFTLTGTGLYSLITPVVTLKGPGLTGTTVVTATGLTAALIGTTMTGTFNLTAPLVAPSGPYDVVITYAGAKTLRLAQAFAVINAAPMVTAVSPTTAWAGSVKPLQTLTVTGSGFVPASPALLGSVGSQVLIGARLTTNTTVVSATQLTVPLTAADIAAAATVPITVLNPVPGGGTSAAVNLTVAAETVAPVTVVSGADANWHKAPVTLTVTASDAQSGVQMTQYAINTTSPATLVGGSITVPAPAGGSGDGVQTVTAWSTDWCNKVETPVVTVTVKIDTVGPKTTATVAASVKKGAKVEFGYRANDISPKCVITLKIKKTSDGSVARTYSLGSKSSNRDLTYKIDPNLAKGKYKYYVYATDQAGNKQSKLGSKSFKVE